MKFLFLLLFISSSILNAQTDNTISIGKIDSIESTILNEKRKIWIYTPNDGPASLYSKQRYPVVYLLDGDAHFSSVVGMIQQLSTVNGNTICPQMIVVGIPNTDRTRDLTPTHVLSDPPYVDTAFSINSGGGEKFISFLEKELIPFVDGHYPTQPYRMLIGHSLGGLMVMQTIIHHTDLFNSYISIDPSMWWDRQRLLKESQKILAEKKFEGHALYLGIANTMDPGMDIIKVRKDTNSSSRHIRSILALQGYLEANKQNGLKYQGKYYGMDDHGSVPLITEYDAIRFIFDFYRLKLTNKDFSDTTIAMVHKLRKHYENVSKQFGYKVSPDESLINNQGYNALNNKRYDLAREFFKLNVENYPNSFNVFDSYGDYFIAKNDPSQAIEQLKKALALKENPDSRKKLEDLMKGSTSQVYSLTLDELSKYVAEFEIPGEGVIIKTFMSNGELKIFSAGRPEGVLVPVKLHEFDVKDAKGFHFMFEMEGEKPTVLHVDVPEGVFKAVVIKK
ncbi:MAG: alpha/beta hydrolase-fold protein [Saprospiraceae bacterium]